MVKELNKQNFEQEVIGYEGKAFVDFFADWCSPCRMMTPVVEQLSDEVGKDVKVCKINTDLNNELAAKYNVMSIPTFLVFENGEVTERIQGVTPLEKLIEVLE